MFSYTNGNSLGDGIRVDTIRTLIVDDDRRFRELVKVFLAKEPSIRVIGEAVNGKEAILKTRDLKPDVVLMDVRMPVMNGLDATRRIRDEMPGVNIIILTVFDLDAYKEIGRANGSGGFVLKKNLHTDLLPAIHQACD